MARLLIDFSDRVSIRRPVEDVFAILSDMDRFFDLAHRRAPITVERLSGLGLPDAGDRWKVSGRTWLGRRSGTVEITSIDRPSLIAFQALSRGVIVETVMTLAPDSSTVTVLSVRNRVLASGLRARIIAPIIRLFRKRITKGLSKALNRIQKRLDQPNFRT